MIIDIISIVIMAIWATSIIVYLCISPSLMRQEIKELKIKNELLEKSNARLQTLVVVATGGMRVKFEKVEDEDEEKGEM